MNERVRKALHMVAMATELGDYDSNVIGMAAEIIAEYELSMEKTPRGSRAVDGTFYLNGQKQTVQVKAWSEHRIKKHRFGTFLTVSENPRPDLLLCLLVYSSKPEYKILYNDSPLKVGKVEKNRPVRVIRFDDMKSREEIVYILKELGVDMSRRALRPATTRIETRSEKQCSICGTIFPIDEFNYDNRTTNSYCRSCCKAHHNAYVRGGSDATRLFREVERAKWKN